jgi:hypothetical protein
MNLDRIVKLLPLGAVILIGLGVLKTSVYYNYFGVDIMSYLTTSEVLTLFLNDLQPILVLILIALVHLNISERLIEGIENEIGEQRFEKFIRDKKWAYFIFFTLQVHVLGGLIYFNCVPLNNWLIYLLVFSSFQLTFFFFIRKRGDGLIRNPNFMHLFTGICMLSIIPLMSLKEIRNIENNKGLKVQLTTNDGSKIKSSRNNRFLGKAGENYFFYNPTKKETTIYKTEIVDRVELKR